MKATKKVSGFTLIELLVVVAIIGILASVVLASLNSARNKARDVRRLSDMRQVQTALEMYYSTYGSYPAVPLDDGTGWDVGNQDLPFMVNSGGVSVFGEYMPKPPVDPTATGALGYLYYKYAAGTNGCPSARGAYYLLMIVDMETSTGTYPSSPGFACTGRDWKWDADWVTGKFEN